MSWRSKRSSLILRRDDSFCSVVPNKSQSQAFKSPSNHSFSRRRSVLPNFHRHTTIKGLVKKLFAKSLLGSKSTNYAVKNNIITWSTHGLPKRHEQPSFRSPRIQSPFSPIFDNNGAGPLRSRLMVGSSSTSHEYIMPSCKPINS